MPNLGGPELIIVLAIFVLLFGAKKLPELGGSIGRSIRNFKQGINEAADDDGERSADAGERTVDEPPRAVTSGEQPAPHTVDDTERARSDRR